MITKKVKYTDYNGKKQTETLHFNLTLMELNELNDLYPEPIDKLIETASKEADGRIIAKIIKDLILYSYGIKSEDGKKFVKFESLRKEFDNSLAFEEVYAELLMDPVAAEKFIEGITPNNIDKLIGAMPEDVRKKIGR